MKNLSYNWKLSEAEFTKDKGKVFSCFACGGGSTMGYKLAGFDVLGCNEIDPKMIEAYKVNHNPKYAYLEPIQTFKLRKDLPKELYNLDILDGSPPCSSFSMAGNRGDDWGKEKKFREGQAEQVLDTLFFDFIDLAKELKPKIVVAENVKGLLLGEARNYVRRILKEFDEAGYFVVYNLLDASKMGIPQRRERVFFTAIRKDLAKNLMRQVDMFTEEPYLKLEFNEKPIYFKDVYKSNSESDRLITAPETLRLWNLRKEGDLDLGYPALREGKEKMWNHKFLIKDNIPLTFTTNSDNFILFDEPRKPNKFEVCCIGSYPQDYDFNGNHYSYLIGMSVPPLMTARLANELYNQWIKKLT